MKPEELLAEVMQTVIDAIEDMKIGGLADYGQVRNLSKDEYDRMVEIWTKALAKRNVRIDAIRPAAERLIARGSKFPKPAEFADECEAWRSENFKLIGVELAPTAKHPFGSILVREFPRSMPSDECKAIVRSEALAQGKQLAEHEVPALPGPQRMASTDDLRNHMAKALRGVA